MIKTLKTLAADERESIKPPKTVNDVIPISRIWDDGIFLAGNRYSVCYRFPDINYAVASEADRKDMSEAFQRMINSLDPAEAIKFSVFNRRITRNSLSGVLHYHRNDMNDPLRDELNSIIKTNSRDSDGIFQDKFITLSVVKDRHKDAKHYFETAAEELRSKFRALSSDLIAMPTADRLQMIRSFLRSDEEYLPPVELKEYMLWGRGFLNEIAPRSLSVEKDYMRIGSRYAQALYLKDYAVQLSDSMLMRLSEMRRDMIMSVDIVPIPKDEAIKDVQKRLLGVESEITKWQQRQNKNNNFSAEVPYELNARRELTDISIDYIRRIFYEMNWYELTTDGRYDEEEEMWIKTVYVHQHSMTYKEAADHFEFNDYQREILYEMMKPEYCTYYARLMGVNVSGDADVNDILALLPAGKGGDVARAAISKLGAPYVLGARGDDKFDCSGLVCWAINQVDPDLGDHFWGCAADQAYYCYSHDMTIEQSELQPGDLIYWQKSGCSGCGRWNEIHHTGIYIGLGKVIEASSSKGRVVIRDLWSSDTYTLFMFGRPYS